MTLLITNWKMAPEKIEQAQALAKETAVIAKKNKNLTLVVCPPLLHIMAITKQLKTPLLLSAQDVAATTEVASTGLVSVPQLKSAGVQYALVGHSEVRARGEDNGVVLQKVALLLEKKIIPVVCIGERARDAHGWYLSEVKDQVSGLLEHIPKNLFKSIVFAYEPVWAIGAQAEREATPLECREMIIYIRKLISDVHGEKFASNIKIIYGGSVNELNAKYFLTDGDAGGLLVGRVSLDAKKLSALVATIS